MCVVCEHECVFASLVLTAFLGRLEPQRKRRLRWCVDVPASNYAVMQTFLEGRGELVYRNRSNLAALVEDVTTSDCLHEFIQDAGMFLFFTHTTLTSFHFAVCFADS
jgi:hypothetical protein